MKTVSFEVGDDGVLLTLLSLLLLLLLLFSLLLLFYFFFFIFIFIIVVNAVKNITRIIIRDIWRTVTSFKKNTNMTIVVIVSRVLAILWLLR